MNLAKLQASSQVAPPPFRTVFDQHGNFVGRCLRMLGVSRNDLDDALQEVFLAVFQRMRDYEERGRLRPWLYSICIRVAWSRQRTLRRRREDCVECPNMTVRESQHDRAVDREALVVGLRLLQRLSPEQREVFWLYEVEELPMSEIARAIDCPMQTAYSRLHTARERVLGAVKLAAAKERQATSPRWSMAAQSSTART